MKAFISRYFLGSTPREQRDDAEHNSRRVMESLLAVASLYGVDIASVDVEWFHDQTTR
ncbi:hypothetical protein KXR87_16870 [Yokenella regensburgei]|uniref:hypothetical protein n=1 Tax=Yokenella regensburgei TaxID=158877 RepID=UPI003F13907E